jgi:hypothetical protein
MFCEKMVDLVRRSLNFILISFICFLHCIFHSATNERNKDQQPDLVPTSLQYRHETTPSSSIPGMDDAEFRRRGKEMIDYIADYLSHIR